MTSAYVARALLAGVVGVLVIGRMNVAGPSVGPGWELTAIAAAVVGGLSLSGGEGRMTGIAAGAILSTGSAPGTSDVSEAEGRKLPADAAISPNPDNMFELAMVAPSLFIHPTIRTNRPNN
nr:hypothetical protein [Streptomyces chartreusis]